MSSVVTVTKEVAVKLLEILGVTTAKKLTVERIAKKMSNLKTLVEKTETDLSTQPSEVLSLIQDVKNGATVELKAEKRVKPVKPAVNDNPKAQEALAAQDKDAKERKAKKAPAASKKEKAPAEQRFTRAASLILSLSKGGLTHQQLMEKADKMYVDKTGGPSNLRETKWVAGVVLSALRTANLIQDNGDKIVRAF